MLECTVTEESGLTCINLNGRLDGMTSSDIQRCIGELIQSGKRVLIADFTDVNYVSSAGLRAFIILQKQLKSLSGEIIICGLSGLSADVFRISGFDKLFRIVSSPQEVIMAGHTDTSVRQATAAVIDGISFNMISHDVEPGVLTVIGSQEKLENAGFTETDVVPVQSNAIRFGTGLAALGSHDSQYMSLFGESVVLNNNLFVYPAVKRPAVDFMLCENDTASVEYKFLHGFGFTGAYKAILSFEASDPGVDLSRLVNAFFEISQARLMGIVLLAESKGLWGMHLKQVPIAIHSPANGKGIFDESNFTEWFNFPVESGEHNCIIAASGIALRDRPAASGPIQALLPGDQGFHFHGAVCAPGPLNKNAEQFESELERVVTELEVLKVQHILGQSMFGSGIAGIIELKG